MHFSAFSPFVFAVLATAQTTSSRAVSGCGSQIDLIISSCLDSTEPQLLACTPNDWDCMCTQSINVLTCYNNCPSAPDRFGYEQTKVANYNAASAYGTSSKSTAKTTGSSVSLSFVAAAATTTASGSSTMIESASTSGSSTAENATAIANSLPARGILAAVFDIAALL